MAAPNFRTNTNCLTTTLSPSIAFFFLASNSIGTIYRAYYRRDYYTVGFVLFEYSAFLLLDLCLTAFHKLPSQNRTKWRKFLQLAIWVFYSAIVFGISTYFGPLFGDPVYGYSIYVVSVVGSVLLFYVYVIWDGSESGCDEYCLGAEKVTTEVKYQVYYDYDSVLEKRANLPRKALGHEYYKHHHDEDHHLADAPKIANMHSEIRRDLQTVFELCFPMSTVRATCNSECPTHMNSCLSDCLSRLVPSMPEKCLELKECLEVEDVEECLL